MIDGLWIIQFEGIQGGGSGVAVFLRGKIYGGESGFTYVGEYAEHKGVLSARVKIHRFSKEYSMLLPVEIDDYELKVTGKINGNSIRGEAAPIGVEAMGFALKLTKYTEL